MEDFCDELADLCRKYGVWLVADQDHQQIFAFPIGAGKDLVQIYEEPIGGHLVFDIREEGR